MLRSFTDRVLGGVCGGLAAALNVDAWLLRVLFILITLVSRGAFAVLYVLLWWLAPQQSPVMTRQRGVSMVVVLLLAVLIITAWFARDLGVLRSPTTGAELFWVGALLLLSAVFFIRQVRA